MRIVEIKELENGAHSDQVINGVLHNIPDGWAVVPDGMELENFPFGTLKAQDDDGVMVVVEWIPGIIPEPEPTPDEPDEPAPTVWDELAAAYTEGVNSIDE